MILRYGLRIMFMALACALIAALEQAQAHPGRTNAQGCHAGKQPYHCHNSKPASEPAAKPAPASVPATTPATSPSPASAPATTPATKSKNPGKKWNENAYNAAFCESVGGRTQVYYDYTYNNLGETSHVWVDCETDTMVYEGGMDKRSSIDSLQQALFFSHVSGKPPVIVIYDTDGKVGRFEYRIKTAADMAGVRYMTWRRPQNQ